MKTFSVSYQGQPWRNRRFQVHGICKFDILNPCWNNRKSDIPGKHWAGGNACENCTKAAIEIKCHAHATP